MRETQDVPIRHLIPVEFLEPNWRFWSFVFISILGSILIAEYRVPVYDGLTDPFYTPTVLILPLVVLFRLTCYAYRKDYHRHLFYHPNSCPSDKRIDNAGRIYTGETGFFRIENIHRYFMYTAWAILPFFYYDIYYSTVYSGSLTVTLGTIILTINAVAVTFYTFSCHSVRHLIGGYRDCTNCPVNKNSKNLIYRFQSKLNSHHEAIAWTSLIMFVFVDLFIRGMVAGIVPNIILIHRGF
jgi:tryptophan-rich sensory protein